MLKPQDQKTIKAHNCKMVLNIIKDSRSDLVSRAKIAKIIGMSPTSITRIVSDLIRMGLIIETDTFSSGLGRKARLLDIIEDAFYIIGVSIDSDYLNICLINYADELVDEHFIELERRKYVPEEIMNIVYIHYKQLLVRNRIDEKKVVSMGISCAGNVDYITGEIVFAPQLKWEKVDLLGYANKLFKVPITVDNDTKMSLIGAVRRTNIIKNSDVAYISIGTGVGSAIMYGGKLIRGVNNAAGEIGHTKFNLKGRLCDCGRYGCLQTYLTETETIKNANEIFPDVNTFDDLFDLYLEHDINATKLIDELCEYIAITINNIAYIYNPRYILVAGKLIFNFPKLFDLSVKKVRPLMHDSLYKKLLIERVVKRDNAAYGASLTAQVNYLDIILKKNDLLLIDIGTS